MIHVDVSSTLYYITHKIKIENSDNKSGDKAKVKSIKKKGLRPWNTNA